jgi:phage repressor protein C with HTH and peptisase S24 domain
MIPTLAPGERVTALRRWRPLRVGDLVLATDPRDGTRLMIKRCARVTGGLVVLRGDNDAASTDSREFGPVSTRAIKWLVLPPSRH